MEIKVIEERANAMLERREFIVEIDHPREASPKRGEVRKEFAKNTSIPVDRIVIEHVDALYGIPRSRGLIYAYAKADAVKKTEREHILQRNGLMEKEAVKPAAPREAPKVAPAEEAQPTPKKKEG